MERDRQRSLASGGSCSEEDDEFEDAVEDIAVAFDVALPPSRSVKEWLTLISNQFFQPETVKKLFDMAVHGKHEPFIIPNDSK